MRSQDLSAVNRCLNKEASFKSSFSQLRLDEVQTKTEKGQMVYILKGLTINVH